MKKVLFFALFFRNISRKQTYIQTGLLLRVFSFITLLEWCATKIWRDLDHFTDKTLILYYINIWIDRFAAKSAFGGPLAGCEVSPLGDLHPFWFVGC